MKADGSRWMLVRVILHDATLLSVWPLPATGGRSLLRCSLDRQSLDCADVTHSFGFNDKLRRLFKWVNTCLRAVVCSGNLGTLIKCFIALAAVRMQKSSQALSNVRRKERQFGFDWRWCITNTCVESSKEDSRYFSVRSHVWRLSGCISYTISKCITGPTGEQTKEPHTNGGVQAPKLCLKPCLKNVTKMAQPAESMTWSRGCVNLHRSAKLSTGSSNNYCIIHCGSFTIKYTKRDHFNWHTE